VDYAKLTLADCEDAALRRRQRLQPVGGKGDKIFPPTYPPSDEMKRLLGERNAPPRHVFERRQIAGAQTWCVLLDSVQSQANRLEEALLAAVRDRSIELPYLMVDFAGKGLDGVNQITSLDAPHRVYDAILRDSLLEGEPFMKSPLGQLLAKRSRETRPSCSRCPRLHCCSAPGTRRAKAVGSARNFPAAWCQRS